MIKLSLKGIRSNWPEVVRSASGAFAIEVEKIGAYQNGGASAIQLTAQEIERMDEVLID